MPDLFRRIASDRVKHESDSTREVSMLFEGQLKSGFREACRFYNSSSDSTELSTDFSMFIRIFCILRV